MSQKIYDKHTWTAGEEITAEQMNHLEDGVANIDDIITISDNMPTATNNRLWIQSAAENEIILPTWTEFENFIMTIAPIYSTEEIYMQNDCVFYKPTDEDYHLYKCNENNVTGNWNPSKWISTTLIDIIKTL